MSLGVAGIGAIFFALVGARAHRATDFVGPAEWTALVTVALLVGAFAIAFWLPRRARESATPSAAPEPGPRSRDATAMPAPSLA